MTGHTDSNRETFRITFAELGRLLAHLNRSGAILVVPSTMREIAHALDVQDADDLVSIPIKEEM